MEESEIPNDKKSVNRAKSHNSGPTIKLRSELGKHKSYNVNEAVRSLDLALGRLKKSKLVTGEYSTCSAHTSPVRRGPTDMFMEVCSSPPGIDNASLMSMNFSHYELMRNLSCSNCNSDGAFSNTTCNSYLTQADLTVKDEHLERYFRSVEMWNRNHRDGGPSNMHFEIAKK